MPSSLHVLQVNYGEGSYSLVGIFPFGEKLFTGCEYTKPAAHHARGNSPLFKDHIPARTSHDPQTHERPGCTRAFPLGAPGALVTSTGPPAALPARAPPVVGPPEPPYTSSRCLPEFSWDRIMATRATTDTPTMYQAGDRVEPVTLISQVPIMAAVPPKMALARLNDSAKPV